MGLRGRCVRGHLEPIPQRHLRTSTHCLSSLGRIVRVNLSAHQNEVTNAQADFTDQIGEIVSTFFPPSDPSFPLGQGIPWISALISLVFGLGGLIPEIGAAERVENVGLSSFGYLVGAGFTMATNNLQPSPGSNLDTVLDMQNFCKNISQSTRDMLSSWANSTFLGTADVNNHTILYVTFGPILALKV